MRQESARCASADMKLHSATIAFLLYELLLQRLRRLQPEPELGTAYTLSGSTDLRLKKLSS